LLVVGGCQSGAQSDLVSRELRLQEDKIYAMQDYLAQYQQLLCQVRAENAALKQQLAAEGTAVAAPSRSKPSSQGAGDAAKEPGASEPPNREPTDFEIPSLDAPKLNVPKTMDQSSIRPERTESPTHEAGEAVHIASYADDSAHIGRDVVAQSQAGASAAAVPIVNDAPPADRVWLSGEVVPNETGGPRLVVDVTPLTESGRPAAYAGEVSLMVLATSETGPPNNLARWDFSPGETALAAGVDGASPHTLQFHLELPPGTPVGQPVQLWVRLKTDIGHKLLANVPLDFQRPGGFASVPFQSSPGESQQAPVAVRVVDAANVTHHSSKSFTPNAGDGWTIARPGETGSAAVRGPAADSEWRASSQPIPMAVTPLATVQPTPDLRSLAESVAQPAGPAQRPTVARGPLAAAPWSPDRQDNEKVAVRPPIERLNAAVAPSGSPWSPTR
jgi:hypothetical protein